MRNEERFIRAIEQGIFVVDGFGRIWRLARMFKGRQIPIEPRRAEVKHTKGYLEVWINNYRCLAHRVIWWWFYGPIHPGMEVNHKNGVKRDNVIGNLEVVTAGDNNRHAVALGLATKARGEHAATAKLMESQVLAIRKEYRSCCRGKGQRALASKYGVSTSTIRAIVRRRSWTHI